MIEALGQLCVFYLLKGDHPGLTEKVDQNDFLHLLRRCEVP